MNMENIINQVSQIDNESSRLLNEIKKYIPAGSSSTMRVIEYHKPLVIDKAEGPYIWNADGERLIDFNMGYGPLIFGHRSHIVNHAIVEQLNCRGAVLGFSTSLYKDIGELISDAYPSIEMMRFASTGTEVNQTAIRLARAYTGRNEIILFEGHYHGSSDSTYHKYNCLEDELKNEGDFSVTPGTDGMGGAPRNAYVLPWNDYDAISDFLKEHGKAIAGIIMEPVMGNSGVIPPKGGYLQHIRKLCDKYGIVLIFDEIITGSRIARGGAQEKYGVRSDITTLSKAAIGGVSGSIIGGKKDIMQLLVENKVFHGGVYSGNPLTLGVSIATQTYLKNNEKQVYEEFNQKSELIANKLQAIFDDAGISVCINNVGAMISLFFLKKRSHNQVTSFREYIQTDKIKHIVFQHILQDMGVYIHPNNLEPWYLSTAHSYDIINEILEIMEKAANKMREINF